MRTPPSQYNGLTLGVCGGGERWEWGFETQDQTITAPKWQVEEHTSQETSYTGRWKHRQLPHTSCPLIFHLTGPLLIPFPNQAGPQRGTGFAGNSLAPPATSRPLHCMLGKWERLNSPRCGRDGRRRLPEGTEIQGEVRRQSHGRNGKYGTESWAS